MPRRRGEYSLSKSVSYGILPGLFPVHRVKSKKSSKFKGLTRLNHTINNVEEFRVLSGEDIATAPVPNSYHYSSISNNSTPVKERRKSVLFRDLFYRKSKGYDSSHRRSSQNSETSSICNTRSCNSECGEIVRTPKIEETLCFFAELDSSFRTPRKGPFDKVRLRTPLSLRRQTKQPPVKVLSFVSFDSENHQHQQTPHSSCSKSRVLPTDFFSTGWVLLFSLEDVEAEIQKKQLKEILAFFD
ncbi:unnamed protein product [Enterobius vermicularis]|uniref:Ovate family protein n=1 Tax=Enterobius vermicularis TaxID=51028 RepID=A0A0N4V326_ENTVE|nr:unnamed protein product [Enterobius vermicularis]